MKQVLSFLIAALFAAVSVQGFAAEEKKAEAKK